jgi:ubiquinone/menaquinone biosynthesis C-methylase UbiE
MASVPDNPPVRGSAAPEEQTRVRGVYETIAKEYDERIPGTGPTDELFTDAEFDFVLHKVQPTDHVLDMGCGTGRFTLPLAQRAARVSGLDISSEMLAVNGGKLAEHGLQPDLHEGTMTALPFPDATFDVIISMLALMHIPVEDRQRVFAEAARVLKPGGRLVVGVKNEVFERLFSGDRFATVDVTDVNAGELIFTETRAGQELSAPWYSFSPDDLSRLTALAGLRLVNLRGNSPLSAWLADAVLEETGLRSAVRRLENVLGDIPPFSYLGYHLLAEAVKPLV